MKIHPEKWMQRPWRVLAALALLVAVLGHRAPFVKQDHSPERIFAANEEARSIYHEMVEAFGTDEVVLVQLRGALRERGADLVMVARLARDVASIPGVRRVDSPADLFASPGGEIPEDLDESEVRAIANRLDSLPVYRTLGLDLPDLPALGAAVSIVMKGPHDRTKFNAKMKEVAARYDALGYRTVYAGLTPANAAIDRETKRALGLFLPLVVAVVLLVGLAMFRSFRVLAAMLLPPGGAVIVGVSGLAMAGVPIDLATGVMPPLVLAIGFAGTIHLVSHYGTLRRTGLGAFEAVSRTIEEKWKPTLFAFLTTAIGFGSLSLSAVPSVRALGIASAGSMVAASILVVLGTPAILALLKPDVHSPPHRRILVESVARWSLSHRAPVLLGVALTAAFAATGIARVETSIDGVKLLAADVPERRAFELIESGGVGLSNFEIWIRGAVDGEAGLLDGAGKLDKLAADVRGIPLVTGTVGVNDVLRAFQARTTGRAGIPDGLAAMELLDNGDRAALDRRISAFFNPERGFRLTVLSRTGSEDQVASQVEAMTRAATKRFPSMDPVVTGHFYMLIGTPGALMRTLYLSLAATVGVIGLLLLIAFRSFRMVAGAVMVNLLPVAVVVGVMGWLAIPMDVATVMTASVAYGLAVDDTYHYLHHARGPDGLIGAARIVGQGIMGTSLAIGCGFSVLALSGFNPVVRFGAFTAFALAVALVADMVVLPVLVAGRRGSSSGEVQPASRNS